MLKTRFLIALTLMIAFTSLTQGGGGNLPPNWWKASHARQVDSLRDLDYLLANDWKNKFVFVDFYLKQCYWCWKILDDFNRLADNLKLWYGEDQVEIIKVDGGIARDISSKYGIEAYPRLMVIYPNSNGNTMNIFKDKDRNYENF